MIIGRLFLGVIGAVALLNQAVAGLSEKDIATASANSDFRREVKSRLLAELNSKEVNEYNDLRVSSDTYYFKFNIPAITDQQHLLAVIATHFLTTTTLKTVAKMKFLNAGAEDKTEFVYGTLGENWSLDASVFNHLWGKLKREWDMKSAVQDARPFIPRNIFLPISTEFEMLELHILSYLLEHGNLLREKTYFALLHKIVFEPAFLGNLERSFLEIEEMAARRERAEDGEQLIQFLYPLNRFQGTSFVDLTRSISLNSDLFGFGEDPSGLLEIK